MSELPYTVNVQSNESRIPIVSVVMPVYNGEKYLTEAVESILNQKFRDFEFLVIDDGSTDNSLNLLRQYAARDTRLQVITRENRGEAFTANELLTYARGEFVARMDQDDIALPNRFELQVNFLKENPKVVALGGAYQMIDSAGRYLTTLIPPQTDIEIQQLNLAGHTAINNPTAMMRRMSMKLVGGYNIELHLVDDLDLWLRLGEVGELANLADVLLKYRLHDQSISAMAGMKQRDAARSACESAWRRRNITAAFTATALWRPSSDSISRHAFMLKYGWWAWSSRQRKTAAFYGWQAIKVKPFSMDGWKLLFVPLFKPLEVAEKD